MVAIEVTEEERQLVEKSLTEFALFAGVSATTDISSYPTLRRLQIEHCRWQATKLDAKADCSLAVLCLGIVEEACWELPVAIEGEQGEEAFDALGDVLIFTCGVCTELRLDFATLSRDFDASNIVEVRGLDGIMNLYKAIGKLAHVVVHHRQFRRGYGDIDKTRMDAGVAIASICSAVHWLAFSNDWDASVLFEQVLTGMMAKRDWSKNSINGEESVSGESEETPIVNDSHD